MEIRFHDSLKRLQYITLITWSSNRVTQSYQECSHLKTEQLDICRCQLMLIKTDVHRIAPGNEQIWLINQWDLVKLQSVTDVIKHARVTSRQPSCEKHDELDRWKQLNISKAP